MNKSTDKSSDRDICGIYGNNSAQKMGRVMIAGTASGCGKTTIVCGILAALKARGLKVCSFKCGPDYIDPMFHRSAIGIPSYNLDPWFYDAEGLNLCCGAMSGGSDISIIEGVMGYYDGLGFTSACSSYQVAADTRTPVVLVVDAAGMGCSSIATIEGFLNHDPGFASDGMRDNNIRGVIFNRMPKRLYPEAEKKVRSLGILPLGFLPRCEDIHIDSRHLGLVTPDGSRSGSSGTDEKLRRLSLLVNDTIDLDGILNLASSATPLIRRQPGLPFTAMTGEAGHRIAIAQDPAFCFFYPQDAMLLEELGCELVHFAPAKGEALPEGIGGLILPGGYPELYAKEIASNTGFLRELKEAVLKGLPTIAECGGFMVLHYGIEAEDGTIYPMAGVVRGCCNKGNSLRHFGYLTLTAADDGLLTAAGDVLKGHEFHYWSSQNPGSAFSARKASNSMSWDTGYSTKNLYAGFPHIPLSANLKAADRFVKAAAAYQKQGNIKSK
jgi:cobyrinic acid a,c-diamide synthase